MAEKIVNEFTVNRPIEEAWPIICDLEQIAPCMPGAQLDEIEGEIHRGRVKVKLGPINAQFKGEAHFIERDDVAHTAALKASGRDTGGRGNADAEIHASAESLSPTSTKCTVTAHLNITGKVAQFGRNVMNDVSKKLIDQFADNLNTMLDEQGPAESMAEAAPEPADSTGDQPGEPTAEEPKIRKIDGPAAEPVDLATFGPTILKQVAPLIIAVLLIVFFVRRRS